MRYISTSLLISVLVSCGGNKTLRTTIPLSGESKYELNSYVGCCGCKAKYFDLKQGNRIVEEVIYSYNCSGNGIPTKFLFTYSEKGKVLNFTSYVATTAEDFEIKLTASEQLLFATIEKDPNLKGEYDTISLSEIKGFRRLIDGELGHSFPLIKNGFKLQSR